MLIFVVEIQAPDDLTEMIRNPGAVDLSGIRRILYYFCGCLDNFSQQCTPLLENNEDNEKKLPKSDS